MTSGPDLAPALRLHQAGRLDEAEALYRSALDHHPDHAEALHLLAVIRQQRGDEAAAADLFRRSLDLIPDWPASHLGLGTALSGSGDRAGAALALRTAVALAPGLAAAHFALGGLHAEDSDLAGAVACYRRAAAARPDLASARYRLGDALARLGRGDQAVAAFQAWAEDHPDQPLAWLWLADIYGRTGHLDQAAAALAREAALAPEPAPPRRSVVIAVLDRSPGSTWNIETLLADLAGWDGEVICIFNAEPMWAALKDHPRIDKWSLNKHNVGVGRAWNMGLNQAEGEVVFILNADMHIGAAALERLEHALLTLPDAALVGVDGDWLDPANQPRPGPDLTKATGPVEVDRVSGFLLGLHTGRLYDAGISFDPRLAPFYHEETDLCLKARAAGLKLYVVPETDWAHEYGISRVDRPIHWFGRPVDRTRVLVRNGLRLLFRMRRMGR